MENKEISLYDLKLAHVEQANEIALLRKELAALQSETREVLAAFQAAKGAFTFLDGLAKIVKPILFLAGVAGALMLFLKTGNVKI